MNALTFQLLPIGKPTANGRIYTREVAESIVQQVMDKPDRILCVRAGTPIEDGTIPLDEANGVIQSAKIDGDAVVVSVRILDTPPGKILKDLLGVRSIGTGMVDDNGVVTEFLFGGAHFGPEEQLNAPE